MRTALFATVALLERLGHRVEFPAAQICCGQMHVNTGYQRQALPLIPRYVETFAGYDAVVVPSGSPPGRPAIRCACSGWWTGP